MCIIFHFGIANSGTFPRTFYCKDVIMQKFHLISGSVWDSTDAKEVLRNVQSNCLGEAKLLMRFLPTMTTSSASNPAQPCSPTLPQQSHLLSSSAAASIISPNSIRGNDYSNEFHNGLGDKNHSSGSTWMRRHHAEDDDSPLPNSSHEEVMLVVVRST